MSDELTIVHVAENALIEFIEQVARGRATNIHASKGDSGWTVTYKSPFTREVKECPDIVPTACSRCEHNKSCLGKPDFKYCNGKFFIKQLPLQVEAGKEECKAAL